MQASMSIQSDRLKLFQELVKQHDLRFKGNPLVIGEKAWVNIDGDHLPPGGCNEFFADWKRFNTPVREISTPVWKRILRRAGIPI